MNFSIYELHGVNLKSEKSIYNKRSIQIIVSIFLVFLALQQASILVYKKVIVADYWLGSLYCGAKSNLFVVCAASEESNSFSAYSDIDTILAFLTMPIISEKYNFSLV